MMTIQTQRCDHVQQSEIIKPLPWVQDSRKHESSASIQESPRKALVYSLDSPATSATNAWADAETGPSQHLLRDNRTPKKRSTQLSLQV